MCHNHLSSSLVDKKKSLVKEKGKKRKNSRYNYFKWKKCQTIIENIKL